MTVIACLEYANIYSAHFVLQGGFWEFAPFDPLGLDSPENRLKEVKNGRLAMIAFAGFMVQALATRFVHMYTLK